MSQNDLSIANQGFASFRSDLNSALQALGSTNSGTSAPSTTYANQLFYDTTNNILKIRNEDNDAFISLFTLDQTNDNIEALTIDGTLTYNGDLVSSTAGTSNFRAGVNAGNSITSGGNYNVTIGDEAGTALTTGDNNVAVGFEALKTEDTHGFNVAVGYQALKTLNAGQEGYHTAVGYLAGTAQTTAFANTLIGGLAGDALTTGNNNVAVGVLSLSAETQGQKNTAVGYGTLEAQNNTSSTDAYNTAVGFSAGNDITTGTYNTIMGGLAGDALTTGEQNVAIGAVSLSSEQAGDHSVGVGYGVLSTQNGNSGSVYNVALGYFAGASITTGIRNVLCGALAGDAFSDADYNVGIGFSALTADTKGVGSVAIGYKALALQNYTSVGVTQNTAIGYLSGDAVTTGNRNTFCGYQSGSSVSTTFGNAFYGNDSGVNSTGSLGTLIGDNAGQNATGNSNTLIGQQAGYLITSGGNNTLIGRYDGNSSDLGDIRTQSNYIVLSDGDGNTRVWVTGGSNQNQFFATGIYLWTTSASANVVVTSSAGHIARSTSALKYKQDIRDLEDIDIDKFRPIRYKSKSDIDDQTKDHFGFIADEVHDEGITELVSYGDDNEVEGFQYERLTAVLVKTLQEQKKTIASLEARIAKLEGN